MDPFSIFWKVISRKLPDLHRSGGVTRKPLVDLTRNDTRVIPCQVNKCFAKFARPTSNFYEIWHTCIIMPKTKSVQIFTDIGQAVSEIVPSKKWGKCRFLRQDQSVKCHINCFLLEVRSSMIALFKALIWF